jgi:transcription termination/antitermination protein NusG
MMNPWYALQVPTGEESETADACRLSLAGVPVEIMLFTIERLKRYRGAWHKEIRPMFPGYLIFEGEPAVVCAHLSGLVAFHRVLKNVGIFKPLRDSEAEFLKSITDDTLCARLSEGYIEGGEVFITRGPMVNLAGKIKKIDRHKRTAIVETEMLGRPVELKLGLEVIACR